MNPVVGVRDVVLAWLARVHEMGRSRAAQGRPSNPLTACRRPSIIKGKCSWRPRPPSLSASAFTRRRPGPAPFPAWALPSRGSGGDLAASRLEFELDEKGHHLTGDGLFAFQPA